VKTLVVLSREQELIIQKKNWISDHILLWRSICMVVSEQIRTNVKSRVLPTFRKNEKE